MNNPKLMDYAGIKKPCGKVTMGECYLGTKYCATCMYLYPPPLTFCRLVLLTMQLITA